MLLFDQQDKKTLKTKTDKIGFDCVLISNITTKNKNVCGQRKKPFGYYFELCFL